MGRQLREEEKARKKKEKEEREREREEERLKRKLEKEERERELAKLVADREAALQKIQDDMDLFPSLAVEVQDDTVMDDVEDDDFLSRDGDYENDFDEYEEESEETRERRK